MTEITQYREFGPISGLQPQQIVLLLHGYGSNMDDLISLAPFYAEVLPNAIFISPNAPFDCDMGAGHQWFSIPDMTMSAALAGGQLAGQILNDFIDAMLVQFDISDENLILSGFSQGCMMALYAGLRRPNSCAGILGYSGMLADDGNLEASITAKPPVCLVHGEQDKVVPFACLDLALGALKMQNITTEAHARPNLAHGIDDEGIKIGKNFMQKIFA